MGVIYEQFIGTNVRINYAYKHFMEKSVINVIFSYLDSFELSKEISSLAALEIYTQAFKFTTTTTISSNNYIHYCLSVIIYSFPKYHKPQNAQN